MCDVALGRLIMIQVVLFTCGNAPPTHVVRDAVSALYARMLPLFAVLASFHPRPVLRRQWDPL
jgi:hypothetical protein